MGANERDEVEALAWQLCDAETPLTGAYRFDRQPCLRHLSAAEEILAARKRGERN